MTEEQTWADEVRQFVRDAGKPVRMEEIRDATDVGKKRAKIAVDLDAGLLSGLVYVPGVSGSLGLWIVALDVARDIAREELEAAGGRLAERTFWRAVGGRMVPKVDPEKLGVERVFNHSLDPNEAIAYRVRVGEEEDEEVGRGRA